VSAPGFAAVYAEITSEPGPRPQTVRAVFDAILEGEWTPVQVGAFAVALRQRGESSETIAEGARALRAAMRRVEHGLELVLDTCGTGGDGHATLNLSTGAAVIAAAAGVPVAKHGNRAVSSRAGSADVIEALGIPIDLDPGLAGEVLAEARIAFLMAPAHHPALRHAAQARKELGIRTIFNCLGPLANPAGATHQLVGAYDERLLPVLARTLGELGTRRAWVVRSEDGLDELSPAAPTRVCELSDGVVRERSVAPEDFGLARGPLAAIAGGDAAYNARVLRAVLDGEPHAARDAFVLNAAAALVVALGLDPRAAAERAGEALGSGNARRVLEAWRRAADARRPAPQPA
jgi:anthranilate phosphoribosyltransferase